MAGPREWQKARPWAGERAPGEEAKPAGHHQPSLAGSSSQPHWIWVREMSLEEDPRAFPTQRKDTGGVASGWSRGHTQCWGEPGRPPEKWEDPGTPNHTGTKGRRTRGWAGGRGAGELQPALCWSCREVHSTQSMEAAILGEVRTQGRAVLCGCPPILPPAHTGRVTAPLGGPWQSRKWH